MYECKHSYNYLPLVSHSMGSWSTKPATCYAAGSKTRECACGYSEKHTIDKTSHSYTGKVSYTNCGGSHVKVTQCRNYSYCKSTTSKTESHSYNSKGKCVCGRTK